MEYSLPTLTILLDDYNAIIEFQECKKMFKKVYELDFETKKRYEITGDHNKPSASASCPILASCIWHLASALPSALHPIWPTPYWCYGIYYYTTRYYERPCR